MGAAGGSFGQAFASTLAQGLQVMQHNEDRREELDLRKKLVTAQLQAHEAETAIKTRQAKALFDLTQRLEPSMQQTGDMELGQATGQPDMSMQQAPALSAGERLKYALMLDPGAAAKHMLGEEEGFKAVEPGKALLDRTGTVRGYVPFQEGMDPRSLMGALMGGNAAPGGSQAPPAPPVGPPPTLPAPGAAPAEGAPTLGPQSKLDRKITVGSDGKIQVTLGDRNVQYKMEHVTAMGPDGKAQVYRIITNPEDPRQTQTIPLGPAQPPAVIQQWSEAAKALGLTPGSPLHEAAVADMIYASGALQGETQRQAFIQIEAKYRELAKDKTLNAPVTGKVTGKESIAGSAAQAANQQEITQSAAKTEADTRARERAQREEQPLQGADKTKYQQLSSIDRGAGRVLEIVVENPAFVGKGFGAYSKKLQAEMGKAEKSPYAAGALAGAMREFFGNISPQEVEFRKTLLDIGDQLLRLRSGAAITEEEYQRSKGMLGQLTDEPNVFIPAMQRFRKEISAQLDDVTKVATTPASKLRDAARPPAPRRPPPPPGFRRE